MRTAVLDGVRAAERPVVVFDVDSTLLSTSYRHHRILTDFAREHGSNALREFVSRLTPDDFGWEVDGPLRGTAHEAVPGLMDYWWARFFSADYLTSDRPVPGAVPFVQQVHRAGAWVYYLTARHLPEMGPATARSLLDLGFPLLSGRASLHLKPNAAIRDHAFKRVAMDDIARLGTVVATFENDPGNANLFAERFPEAVNVLLDTVCAPDAPAPDPRLVRVPDFQS